MKEKLFYVAAFTFVLLSCSQENVIDSSTDKGSKQGVPFVGGFNDVKGEDATSRTSLEYDRSTRSMTYYWEPGDKIW